MLASLGFLHTHQLGPINTMNMPKLRIGEGWDIHALVEGRKLILGGVDVLDVGGFIQQADDPAKAFAKLLRIADETGTT